MPRICVNNSRVEVEKKDVRAGLGLHEVVVGLEAPDKWRLMVA